MEDAPNPNPATTLMSWNIRYMTVRPISPIPTTLTPMTVPELKASLRAGLRPCCAWTVVRVLARTAMLMPMYPARPDPIAPTRYEIAVAGIELASPLMRFRRSKSMNSARTMKTMTTNMASKRYSRERKAFAPSRMAFPMNWTSSLPSSALRMRMVRMAAKPRATTPETIARMRIPTLYLRRRNGLATVVGGRDSLGILVDGKLP